MSELARQILVFMLGWTGFSFSVWLLITLVLLLGGFVMTSLGATVVDPVAVELVVRPHRVQLWIPISLVALPLLFGFLVATIVGSPLAVIFLFGVFLAGLLGYIAVALIVGDRIARRAGWKLPPWQLSLMGIATIRLIRLVPYVGGVVHTVWILFGLAATTAVSWDIALSWHKRRLPDNSAIQERRELDRVVRNAAGQGRQGSAGWRRSQ